jgi:hypothetical protein
MSNARAALETSGVAPRVTILDQLATPAGTFECPHAERLNGELRAAIDDTNLFFAWIGVFKPKRAAFQVRYPSLA